MKNTFLAIAALATLFSCSSIDEMAGDKYAAGDYVESVEMTVEDFEEDATTRTALSNLSDSGAKFAWAENDTVGIFPNVGDQVSFSMSAGAGTSSATFNGGGWALRTSSSYSAYYPFSRANFYRDSKTIAINMVGQSQDGNDTTSEIGKYDIMAAAPASAETGNVKFAFKHQVSICRIKLTLPENKSFRSVKVISGNKQFITKATMDISGSMPTITATETSEEISLSLKNFSTTSTNRELVANMYVLPVDMSSELLTINVTDTDGNIYSAKDVSGVSFEKAKIRVLSATPLPVALDGEGEGEDFTGDDENKCEVAGHEYVDLGLSVKWATCNVGADKPEDYGGYYAWGETSYIKDYDSYFDSSYSIYNNTSGKTKIEPNSGHDTARENWGGTWRMPTIDELEELNSKCTWAWTSKGGHNGYLVTGPNGNSIFLPAAGSRWSTYSNFVGEYGLYWSSTLSSSHSSIAQYLDFGSSRHDTGHGDRGYGFSVRPVLDDGSINGHKYVDLGLSVKWATCNVGADKPEDYGGYYAWGETTTKSSYDWDNCFDCVDGNIDNWNVYKIGGKTKIEPNSGHDTARENWGGSWRMPTIDELEELYSKCTWTRTSKGGHYGCLFTGPNGNSIFLPAAGCRGGTSSDDVGEYGYYWSSTLSSSLSSSAQSLYFFGSGHGTNISSRRYGFSVRPVTE